MRDTVERNAGVIASRLNFEQVKSMGPEQIALFGDHGREAIVAYHISDRTIKDISVEVLNLLSSALVDVNDPSGLVGPQLSKVVLPRFKTLHELHFPREGRGRERDPRKAQLLVKLRRQCRIGGKKSSGGRLMGLTKAQIQGLSPRSLNIIVTKGTLSRRQLQGIDVTKVDPRAFLEIVLALGIPPCRSRRRLHKRWRTRLDGCLSSSKTVLKRANLLDPSFA